VDLTCRKDEAPAPPHSESLWRHASLIEFGAAIRLLLFFDLRGCAMSKKITIEVPAALLARIRTAAADEFETPESLIPMVLARALPEPAPRARLRNGGKPPASKLLRPLKPRTKRAAIVRWFLRAKKAGKAVTAAMKHFRCSREAIFSHWTAIQRDHGIGYRFDGASDTITVLLPYNVR
jgi:hypothetical protein